MYKSKDRQTLPLFPELFPLGGGLRADNRWIRLSGLIPWEELEDVYRRYFSSGMGRPAKDSRLMCGLLITKHMDGLSDERVVENFMENPYVQALCGYEQFVTEGNVIDPSLLSKTRKRLGKEFFSKFEGEVLGVLIAKRVIRPREQMMDATVVPANITYPTDTKLLHRCREWMCKVIGVMRKRLSIKKKVGTYSRTARAVYVNFQRRRKKKKAFIRKTQKQLLQYVRRNIKQMEYLLLRWGRRLKAKEREFIRLRLEIVKKIFEQQWVMWKTKTHQVKDRIVSLHLPHIRPMVRGKDGKDVEFGPKALLSWVDGFCFLDAFSFDAYNEANQAEVAVERYKERFGKYPKTSIADGIFGTRENRQILKGLNIGNAFKPLGRYAKEKAKAAWLKQKQKKRNGFMEGIIGHGKSHFDLDRILYRIAGGEEIWVRMGLLGMNLSTALKRI